MRLVVLTNIMSPYRAPLYAELQRLAGRVDVLLSGGEDNRHWKLPGRFEFPTKKTLAFTLRRKQSRFGIPAFDVGYLQIPVGAGWDLARSCPDGVLSAMMGFGTALAWLYCTLTNTPLAVHWGGTIHTEKTRSAWKRLVRRFFFARAVPAWVSYGSTSTEYLESLGIPRDRIFEAYNCVDHDFYARPAPPALELSPKPVLLYVGRFIPLKGLDRFIRAASILQKSGRRFSTLLVGSGPQETELRRLASSLGLRNVVFHPFAQLDVLPGLYRSADVFVLPTLQDVWGLVVNEALASGIPVLCSKYAGCAPDLVPESWQFDPFDIEGSFVPALEKAMEKGRDGRKDFLPVSEMRGPRDAARAIMSAIEKAKGGGRSQ